MRPSFGENAPGFTTVDELRPDTSGHNLVVKVVICPCTQTRLSGSGRSLTPGFAAGCGRQTCCEQASWPGRVICT